MLVLSRKVGERIVVPHIDLAITLVAIKGNVVRLGISAPEHVAVFREEVWQQVGQEARRVKKLKRPIASAEIG
jgi:carbon storage regulator